MVFLIQYDRTRGVVISMQKFHDSERASAEDARLALELQNNKEGIGEEVVLLEAVNEKALRRTHRRYFEDLAKLSNRSTPSST